ncbi:unnamed protein product [Cylicocyclus nassatus]|uniref:Uncharacterized protein n=1 Tax=Cylicocyclus nassatus TaxID=53992 RepID=A0AA36M3D1_CYLNA|nr:unnamed protein product [Cylicocyclus nassatus]
MVKPSPDRSAILRLHQAGRPPATIAIPWWTPRPPKKWKTSYCSHAEGRRGAVRKSSRPSFVDPGVKIDKDYYLKTILEDALLPWANSHFTRHPWTFQQNSAPAHKAKVVQAWCKSELPDFIQAEEWPASSPDLNPLDYILWSYLGSKACAIPHPNLDSLKAALIREWDEIDEALCVRSSTPFPGDFALSSVQKALSLTHVVSTGKRIKASYEVGSRPKATAIENCEKVFEGRMEKSLELNKLLKTWFKDKKFRISTWKRPTQVVFDCKLAGRAKELLQDKVWLGPSWKERELKYPYYTFDASGDFYEMAMYVFAILESIKSNPYFKYYDLQFACAYANNSQTGVCSLG